PPAGGVGSEAARRPGRRRGLTAGHWEGRRGTVARPTPPAPSRLSPAGAASGPGLGPELVVGWEDDPPPCGLLPARAAARSLRSLPPPSRLPSRSAGAAPPRHQRCFRGRRRLGSAAAGLCAGVRAPRSPDPSCRMPARSGAQFSRRMGQKKQRLAKAEQPHSPSDTAQAPCPKEPCLGPPTTLGPYRSIYFSSPRATYRLGWSFRPASSPLARHFWDR
uniref:Uncharacterized protein n=1 Tax=Macaca fascicularis TaxID=9541 RepID=A0A7N9CJK3_MACFA